MRIDTRAPEPALHQPGLGVRIIGLLLSDDRKQRRCLIAVLLTLMVYAVCIGILAYGSSQGLFAPRPVRILGTLMAATPLCFYLIIRSGLNRHMKEPTLTFAQGLAAQTLVAGAYAVTGPVHAGNMMLFGLVMIFGMFDMRVERARFLAAYTIVIGGAAMLWANRSDPLNYPANEEVIYFALLATVLTATSQVSVLLSNMRLRLKSQKAEREEALAHIQEMATHDELTGLANRRHILDLLNGHAQRHARGGPSFYVAMADLDHFKLINDTYGHAVGDEALRTFAHQAQAQLRNTDIIGRWGGEEFLLLLPETPPGDPNVGLERLRATLANCPASELVPELRVLFSAGLSRYRDGEAISDTIERADRAVYAAKHGGRNRTVAL